MDAQQWAAQERDAAGPCPACGALLARPIFYGMPDYVMYRLLEDAVVFAGCCLPDVLHRWSCGRCGSSWGAPDTSTDGEET